MGKEMTIKSTGPQPQPDKTLVMFLKTKSWTLFETMNFSPRSKRTSLLRKSFGMERGIRLDDIFSATSVTRLGHFCKSLVTKFKPKGAQIQEEFLGNIQKCDF